MEIFGNNFLGQQILPGVYTKKVTKIIAAFDKNISKAEVENIAIKDLDNLLTQIKKDIENQFERKRGLEDKVKAILFSISISITAITFSLGYEKHEFGNIISIIALVIFVLSILYFIASAIISVKTLLPVAFRLVQTEFEYDEKSNTISIVKQDKKEWYQSLVIAKWNNDNSNNILANHTYTALKLLRNGLILFMMYFLMALVDKKLPVTLNSKSIVFDKVNLKINDSIHIMLPYSYTVKSDSAQIQFATPVIVVTTTRKKLQKKPPVITKPGKIKPKL